MPDPQIPPFESAVLKTYPRTPGAALQLTDRSWTAKTLVRSDRPQFGISFGASGPVGGAIVAATRPGEWLVLGSGDDVREAEAAVATDGFTTVIPFTHGRSLFVVEGTPAAAMLEKVCSIDLSDAMTPDGAVFSASVALTTCDVIRRDTDGVPGYLLVCDRSFGQYLFDALIDAGDEFGIDVRT